MFVLLHLAIVLAQTPDPYIALRALDYETAIAHFQTTIAAAPDRTSLRKDLAYTYLKIGENDLSRDQFAVAMRLGPADTHVASSSPSSLMRRRSRPSPAVSSIAFACQATPSPSRPSATSTRRSPPASNAGRRPSPSAPTSAVTSSSRHVLGDDHGPLH